MQGASGGGAPKHIDDYFVQHGWEGYGSKTLYVPGAYNNDFTTVGGMFMTKCYDNYDGISWQIYDTVRGDSKRLDMDSTVNEQTNNTLTFNQYRVYLDSNNSQFNYWNGSSQQHQGNGWGQHYGCIFKAEDHFFKLGSYSGNGGTQTITHGMKSIPSMIWIKSYTGSVGGNWISWHKEYTTHKGSDYAWALHGKNAAYSSSQINTVTATQFSVNSSNHVNNSSTTYVWYAFGGEEEIWGPKGDQKAIVSGVFNQSVSHSGGEIATPGWRPQVCFARKMNNISGGSPSSTDSDLNRGHSLWFNDQVGTLGAPGRECRQGMAFTSNMGIERSGHFAETFGHISATNEGLWAGQNTTTSSSCDSIYWAIRAPYNDAHADDKNRICRNVYYTGSTSGRRTFSGMTPSSAMPHQRVDLMMKFKRAGNDGNRKAKLVSRFAHMSGDDFLIQNNYWQGQNDIYIAVNNYAGPIAYGSEDDWNNYYQYQRYDVTYLQYTPGVFMPIQWHGRGNGNRTLPHDLGVKPELIMYKLTSYMGNASSGYFHHIGHGDNEDGQNWWKYGQSLTSEDGGQWSNGTTNTFTAEPDKDNLYIGPNLNNSAKAWGGYVFASKTGISKVGYYTGNGGSLDVDCGFTNGIRAIIIKRYDDAGTQSNPGYNTQARYYFFGSGRGLDNDNSSTKTDYWQDLKSNYGEKTFDSSSSYDDNGIDALAAGFTARQPNAQAANQVNLNANNGKYAFVAFAN